MELLKQINLYNLIRLIVIVVSVLLIPLMILEKLLKKVKSYTRKALKSPFASNYIFKTRKSQA